MFFSSKIATLAGPSLLLCGMVAASPLDSNAHLNSARYGNMGKRQQADVQDESDPIDIAANLNKLRSGKHERELHWQRRLTFGASRQCSIRLLNGSADKYLDPSQHRA